MRARTVSRRSSKPPDFDRLRADAAERLTPLRIIVKRRLTGEIILDEGGTWDRVDGEYLEEPCKLGKVLLLNEAQVEAFAAVVAWIIARRAGSKRPIELVFWGGRGSGKTHLAVLVVWLIAVAFPGARCLLVSPANTRRAELEQIISDHIPEAWRRNWSERELKFLLPNDSSIAYVGADDEDALKQGGFEVALLNEAQLMTSQAYANAVAGVRNVSGRPKGLLILAHNPPSKVRGEWVEDHLEKIDLGAVNAEAFKLDPRLNSSIDKDVVDDVDASIRSVRPDLADLDVFGIRRRLGDMATPFRAFKGVDREGNHGHIGDPPTPVFSTDGRQVAGWRDVTRRETARKTDTTNGYSVVVIMDFQRRPGCVAAVGKIFEREDGKLVYHVFHCITANEQEDDLCRQVDSYLETIGLTNRDALAICDATGKFQDSTHRNTKPSWDIVREWSFTVVAPTRQKTSGKTSEIANPLVEESLAQFYDVVMADRFLVSAAKPCDFVAQSLRRCKTKKRGNTIKLDDSKPGYSHYVDVSRYFVAYFEPKRGPAAPAPDVDTANEIRKIRLLSQ